MPEWFLNWLKEPSTLRVLNVVLGFGGVSIAPEYYEEIVVVVGAIWVLIDGFYNRAKRK